MGVYVYAIRPKGIQVILPDGQEISAFPLKYLYKPHLGMHLRSGRHPDAAYHRVIAKLEKSFPTVPQYIVFPSEISNIADGDPVYKWKRSGITISDSNDLFPGEKIGVLKQQNRRWLCISGN